MEHKGCGGPILAKPALFSPAGEFIDRETSASVSKIDSPSNACGSKYGASDEKNKNKKKPLQLLICKITGVGSETEAFCSMQLQWFARHGELEHSNCTPFTSENGKCMHVKEVLIQFTQL